MFNKNNNQLFDSKYKMPERFESNKLFIGNLEVLSSETDCNIITEQLYLFEDIGNFCTKRYREVFTGLIVNESSENKLYNVPTIYNAKRIKEYLPHIKEYVPKFSLLLIMNEINFNRDFYKVKKQ